MDDIVRSYSSSSSPWPNFIIGAIVGVSAGMSISLMMKHQNKLDETSVLLTVIEQYAKATVSLSDDFTSYLLKKYARFQADLAVSQYREVTTFF